MLCNLYDHSLYSSWCQPWAAYAIQRWADPALAVVLLILPAVELLVLLLLCWLCHWPLICVRGLRPLRRSCRWSLCCSNSWLLWYFEHVGPAVELIVLQAFMLHIPPVITLLVNLMIVLQAVVLLVLLGIEKCVCHSVIYPNYLTTVLSIFIPHPTNVTQTIERTVDGWRWRQEGRIIWWLQFQFLQLLTRLRVAQGTPNTKSCQGKKEQREKIPGLYPQSILPAMASESRGCHSAYSNWSIFSYLALYMGFPKQGSEGRWVG